MNTYVYICICARLTKMIKPTRIKSLGLLTF